MTQVLIEGSSVSGSHLTYTANPESLLVDGNAGTLSNTTIDTGAGNDTIQVYASANNNIISLGAGDDYLNFEDLSSTNNNQEEQQGEGQGGTGTGEGTGTGTGNPSVININPEKDINNPGTINDNDKNKNKDDKNLKKTKLLAAPSNNADNSDATGILNNTIHAGDGNDTINFARYAENNIIYNDADSLSVVIAAVAKGLTLVAGSGADYLNVDLKYTEDASISDVHVSNFGAGDSIQFSTYLTDLGPATGTVVGNDYVIASGSHSITIDGAGSDVQSLGSGLFYYPLVGNYFSIDGSRVTQIQRGTFATEYNDTIYAENLSTNIDAREGSDIISIMSGSGIIDGGSGADQIYLGSTTDITIVGSGDVSSLESGVWVIGEDSIYGVGSDYSVASAGDNLFKIVSIPAAEEEPTTPSNIGLLVDTTDVDNSEVDFTQPTNIAIDENGNIAVAGSNTESNAMISIDAANKSATLVMNETDRSYDLTFYDGGAVEKWNATLSGGNDTISIRDIKGGHFDGGEGKDIFNISSNLQGDISLTGGATNEDLESGNNFYAESSSVSSASSQSKITITDVNFNATDVVLIDAGVENLNHNFFGDARFKNYANAADASTSGVYAGTVFEASDVVKNLGMSFSMLRMADRSSVTFDDENYIDESLITNVVWANSDSATIYFADQTDDVLVFTDTNSKGDIVSLVGDFDDTIHAGVNDTIDAGAGDDIIYLSKRNHVVFGNSEGNDTIYGWDSTDTLDISSIPDVSISSGNLYLESENGTLLIDGAFTNSTNIRYNLDGEAGIMRVADSNGNVRYDKSVTYYAGSTLIMNSSSNNTLDLSSSTYENISNIDASGATGRDVFKYTSDAGDVTISNGDSKDIVDLSNYSVDEVSAEFTDSGLVITVGDSNLNIVGTNLTTFSLASGKYTADFSNQTFNS